MLGDRTIYSGQTKIDFLNGNNYKVKCKQMFILAEGLYFVP